MKWIPRNVSFSTGKNPIKFQRTFEIFFTFYATFLLISRDCVKFLIRTSVHQYKMMCTRNISHIRCPMWNDFYMKQSKKKAHPAFNDNAWWCVKCDCYTSISIHQLHSYSVKRECLYNSSISRSIRLVEVSNSVLNSNTVFEMGQMSNASFFR